MAIVVVVGGCGPTSFVSRGYENFTAYYNKFYNAQRSFEAADKRQTTARPIDRQLLLTVFPVSERAASASEYEDTIRRSADVLRGHENSKWVDDALMLIGRSYFNQRNFVSAEQKFREVMALDTKLHDEALYWLARSQIAGNEHEAALTSLEIAVADEEISRRWRPFLYLALGDVNARLGNYEAAADALKQGLKAKDRELTGRARYLLGQIYEVLGDYEEAVATYDLVEKHKPPYELLFAAKVRAIEIGAAHGDFAAADRALRRMERDDKNFEYKNDLALVRGRIQTASGQHDAAVATLKAMLRGTASPTPSIRGGAHYTLAVIYRDVRVDYELAAAHFDSAASALRGEIQQRTTFGLQHSIEDPFAPGAIVDVLAQSETFLAFARVSERISSADSLLTLASMDDDDFRARIEEIRQQRIAEMMEQDRLREQRDIREQFNSGAAQAEVRGLPPGKVIDNDPDVEAAGFLFHREPVRVQQAFERFRDRWGERPLVPGWRVSSNISGVARDRGVTTDSSFVADAAVGSVDRYANFTVDVSDVPRSSIARERMIAERALARYEMGNVLFLSMNQPDSAAAWYRLVIDQDGGEDVAARAYYALAEAYRATGRDEAAREVDAELHQKHPGFDPTRLVASDVTTSAKAVLVELDEADAAYGRAFDFWSRGAYARAIRAMLETASDYPEATAAPRSLLAVGVAAGDWARRDSLDLLDPLPMSLPDSLREMYGWAASDSTAADSLATDSVATDSLAPDSLATDSLATDSLVFAPTGGPTVAAVYEFLIATYPDRPEAAQAEAPLAELRDLASARQARIDSLAMLNQPLADSTQKPVAVASPDSTDSTESTDSIDSIDSIDSTDSSLAQDSTRVARIPDKRKSADAAAEADSLAAAAASASRAKVLDATAVDVLPTPVGGEEALLQAVNFEAFDSGDSGTIELTFIVGRDGRVSQVTIDKGISEPADREVLRAMYQSRYSPGLKAGLPVAVRMKRTVVLTVE